MIKWLSEHNKLGSLLNLEGGSLRLGSVRLVSSQIKATATSPVPSCGLEVPCGSLRLMTHSWGEGTGWEERNPFPEGVELGPALPGLCWENRQEAGPFPPPRALHAAGQMRWRRLCLEREMNPSNRPVKEPQKGPLCLYFPLWPVFCSRS